MSHRIRPSWAAALLLPAALGWTFRDLILRGFILAHGDIPDQFLPWREFTVTEIAAGRVPLWNPFTFCGAPFLANMQSCVLYPVDRLLDTILPPDRALSLGLVLHLLFGGLSLHFLAVRWGAGAAGAALSAIGYALGGFHAIHLLGGNLLTMTSSVYLPAHLLILTLLSERLERGERPGWAPAWGAFLIALQILSGHAQMTFYNGVFAGVFALTLTALRPRGRAAFLLHHVAMWGIGAILAAPQLLPTFEYSRFSSRTASLPYEAATEFSLGWEVLPTLLLPEYLGSRADGFHHPGQDTFWGNWRNWSAVYIGILPAAGFLFLFLSGKTRRERSGALKAFLPLLLVSLFLALGRNNPLYRLVHELPLFGQFRAPSKYLPGFVAPFATLAALGLDSLQVVLRERRARIPDRTLKVLGLLLPVLVLAAFLFLHLQRFLSQGIVHPWGLILWNTARSLSLVCTALLGWTLLEELRIRASGRAAFAALPSLLLIGISFLDCEAYFSRYILSAPAGWIRAFNGEDVREHLPDGERILVTPDYTRQNDSVSARVPSASGYDPFQVGVFVDTFRRDGSLPPALIPDAWAPPLDWARRLGVGMVVSTVAQRHRDLVPLAIQRPFFLYRVSDPAPFVEFRGMSSESLPGSPFHFSWEGNRLHISEASPAEGELLIRQVFVPGWKATDSQGVELPVEKGEPFWQKIRVNSGDLNLTLRYEPWGWTWGLRLFPLGVLAWVALGLFSLRKPSGALHKASPSL